jgi:hypothetical protein
MRVGRIEIEIFGASRRNDEINGRLMEKVKRLII